MAEIKAFFVPHTHWDREWYLPFEVFREKLVELIDKLVSIMDSDPDWRYFLLDGQTIVLEDYFEVRGENPALLKLIREGRIGIGPWYDLPDEFLVSGESIIRNLRRGFALCQKLGVEPVKLGYLPDMFGHISQMPQIFSGFGIEDSVVWRGVPALSRNQFFWKSRDGSRVFAAYLPLGYGFFFDLPGSAEEFVKRFEFMLSYFTPKDASGVYLVQPGTDHWSPDPALSTMLKEVNALKTDWQLKISGPQDYFAEIKPRAKDLPEHTGELRSCENTQILPGVASARLYLKEMNHRAGATLEKYLEPIAVMNRLAKGADLTDRLDYLWKLLLSNHPHDSICGCSVDAVHSEMETRYKKIFELSGEVLGKCLASATDVKAPRVETLSVWNPGGKVSPAVIEFEDEVWGKNLALESAEGKKYALERVERLSREELAFQTSAPGALAFVTLCWFDVEQVAGYFINEIKTRKEGGKLFVDLYVSSRNMNFPVKKELAKIQNIVDRDKTTEVIFKVFKKANYRSIAVLDELDGASMTTFRVRKEKPDLAGVAEVSASERALENKWLKVEVEGSGRVKALDKESGKEIVMEFSDRGDRGDSYNFDPVPGDVAVKSPAKFRVKPGPSGKAFASLDLEHHYKVPAALDQDRKKRSDKKTSIVLCTRIFLYAGMRRVDFETEFENTARDHRLQADFWYPELVDDYWAESGFDLVKRAIVNEKLPEQPEIPNPAQLILGMETAYASSPIQNFACLSKDDHAMAVAGRGLKEVEAGKDDKGGRSRLSLTLCRSIGFLARADLNYRTNQAGPPLEVPDAQCLRKFCWKYSLIFMSGPVEQADVFANVLHFVFPALAFPGKPLAKMPFKLRGSKILLSALYPRKDGKVIARFFNSGFQEEKLELELSENVEDAAPVNLEEKNISRPDLKKSGAMLEAVLRNGEIFTLALKMK